MKADDKNKTEIGIVLSSIHLDTGMTEKEKKKNFIGCKGPSDQVKGLQFNDSMPVEVL